MIKSIDIKNFKSIKSHKATLPFFGAIVGKNAAGKTNLIQSIRFIKDLASGKKTEEAQEKISLIPNELFNFNDKTNEFCLEIILETKEKNKYLLNIIVLLKNETIKPASLIINKEILYKITEKDNKKVIYTREKDNLFDKNGDSVSLAIDQNKLALAVYKNPDNEEVKNTFIHTFIPQIETVSSFGSHGITSVKSEKDDFASILVNLRHKHLESYNKFQIIIKKLLPHFSSLIEISTGDVGSDNEESYLIVLEEENLKGKLSMQSVSAGDLRTLFLVASTLNMENHSSLIVEEIENGMHPKRIIDLIDHLKTISRVKNMQILFTTHSPIRCSTIPQKGRYTTF